jgi:hypothetical protein
MSIGIDEAFDLRHCDFPSVALLSKSIADFTRILFDESLYWGFDGELRSVADLRHLSLIDKIPAGNRFLP